MSHSSREKHFSTVLTSEIFYFSEQAHSNFRLLCVTRPTTCLIPLRSIRSARTASKNLKAVERVVFFLSNLFGLFHLQFNLPNDTSASLLRVSLQVHYRLLSMSERLPGFPLEIQLKDRFSCLTGRRIVLLTGIADRRSRIKALNRSSGCILTVERLFDSIPSTFKSSDE